jgi:uncharacterized protein YbjT (DUF2867 family)
VVSTEWNKEQEFLPYLVHLFPCAVKSTERSWDMKILVTGATGTCGGAVVGDLLKRGASVRALSRKQPEPGKLPQGLEIALGDLTDPPSILKALDGIDKMFLLIGNVADEFTQGVTACGLARRAGVKHIRAVSDAAGQHRYCGG